MACKEFKCIVCGAKGIDYGRGHEKKYCSRECAVYYRRTHRKDFVINGTSCLFNDGVLCEKHECENCGWNPKVEKKRKEALGV